MSGVKLWLIDAICERRFGPRVGPFRSIGGGGIESGARAVVNNERVAETQWHVHQKIALWISQESIGLWPKIRADIHQKSWMESQFWNGQAKIWLTPGQCLLKENRATNWIGTWSETDPKHQRHFSLESAVQSYRIQQRSIVKKTKQNKKKTERERTDEKRMKNRTK